MPTLQPRHAANFYPHSPCGERPDTIRKTQRPYVFLSTLSLRRATVAAGTVCRQMQGISIHTLLAESDPSWATRARAAQLFLSTLSLRRATYRPPVLCCCVATNFYPHSPCGERPDTIRKTQRPYVFLSTLSLRRATCFVRCHCWGLNEFLSTLSLRRATAQHFSTLHNIFISIHTLLAESDSARPETRRLDAISIHTLLAESDHQTNAGGNESGEFLSTLSLRRATAINPS